MGRLDVYLNYFAHIDDNIPTNSPTSGAIATSLDRRRKGMLATELDNSMGL
jgi:hypothetical protein